MDINEYIPSLLNPRRHKKSDILTQNSAVSCCSLSLKRCRVTKPNVPKIDSFSTNIINKENFPNDQNNIQNPTSSNTHNFIYTDVYNRGASSKGFSDIDELFAVINDMSPMFTLEHSDISQGISESRLPLSSATEINKVTVKSDNTVIIKPVISVSFGVLNCESVDVSSIKSKIRRIVISNQNNDMNVDCELTENSQPSTDYGYDIKRDSIAVTSPNKVVVNLEIKKKLTTEDESDNSKVLIMNTNDIGRITNVTVQPPNYNLLKRKILDDNNFSTSKRTALQPIVKHENLVCGNKIKQKLIDSFFPRITKALNLIKSENLNDNNNVEVMSRNSGVNNSLKTEFVKRLPTRSIISKGNDSPTSTRVASSKRESRYSPINEIKTYNYETRRISSPSAKNETLNSHSPRKNGDSIQYNLPSISKSNKTTISPKSIPHHKIVTGTNFAVDAFSYGEIPNVKHYFLSHFHSDHYSGLKKSFSKQLYCSKITGELCVSRLGVNAKYIHVIKVDETIRIEGVDVTAVEANHCPGAVMFVFTLSNGKTLLHTGDFRASPDMESYPIFWNKDIHTIYLDTTYCNPRYDFPTQGDSLEMALYILRQKKFTLEKSGKKFSSVLIVCGTYTIGKEKFFLGMARRAGCSVWACPEKDRVLQTVEGRSYSHGPPQSCQLHVVPMRDLTLEKLRTYLDSLKGAFNEIVAFKPSGWENGKSSAVEKDMVTIHGIPYSEHSSFSELIRFVKYLNPKQIIPTVDISGGIKSVQTAITLSLQDTDYKNLLILCMRFQNMWLGGPLKDKLDSHVSACTVVTVHIPLLEHGYLYACLSNMHDAPEKYFPCPMVCKDDIQCQSRVTDCSNTMKRQQAPAAVA